MRIFMCALVHVCLCVRARMYLCIYASSCACVRLCVRGCVCVCVPVCVCVCVQSELFGVKYSMNQHCSSCQFLSLPTIRIPRRLTTKTSESKMQTSVTIQKPLSHPDTAVRIQKPKSADVSGPSRPSVAADLSPADGVARNGTDAKTHQGRYPNHGATIKTS